MRPVEEVWQQPHVQAWQKARSLFMDDPEDDHSRLLGYDRDHRAIWETPMDRVKKAWEQARWRIAFGDTIFEGELYGLEEDTNHAQEGCVPPDGRLLPLLILDAHMPVAQNFYLSFPIQRANFVLEHPRGWLIEVEVREKGEVMITAPLGAFQMVQEKKHMRTGHTTTNQHKKKGGTTTR